MRALASLLLRPSDDWTWSLDAFLPVSLCVRALLLDGMAVGPFDKHADGDRRLRELGLDAETWRAWVASVVVQHTALGEAVRTHGTHQADGPRLEQFRAATQVLDEPGSFCPGRQELRALLNGLFADDAGPGEAWRQRVTNMPQQMLGSGRQERALWNGLVPFHHQLRTLSVFLVDYPEPVVMPLPPTACLIAPENDPESLGRQVIAAATSLARGQDLASA